MAVVAVVDRFFWSFDKIKLSAQRSQIGSPVRGDARRAFCVTTEILPTRQSRLWVKMRRGVSAAGIGPDKRAAV